MWRNGLEKPTPFYASENKNKENIKRVLFALNQWLSRNFAWLIFWAVCILGFIAINTFANIDRIRPSIGGEGALLIIPLIVWVVLYDEKKKD